jgi:hypothetical protein
VRLTAYPMAVEAAKAPSSEPNPHIVCADKPFSHDQGTHNETNRQPADVRSFVHFVRHVEQMNKRDTGKTGDNHGAAYHL